MPHISGLILECSWEFVEAEYTVRARVDNGEWLNQPLAAPFDSVPDCVYSTIEYGSPSSESSESQTLTIGVESGCPTLRENDDGCQTGRRASESDD